MTQRERDRLVALNKADKKLITQKQAAQQIGLSERQVRRLLAKLRSQGDRAVIHAARGRASNRKISAKVEKRAAAILSKPLYADFGPTLAAEYLQQRHGIHVGRETLRGWMAAAGLWKPRRRKPGRAHLWRPRRRCRGELVQWDTSEHDWLEGRGEKLYLIGMIDDASSELLARFVRHDSSAENRRLLKTYLEKNGRPAAFYTDRASLFVNTPKNSAGEKPQDLASHSNRAGARGAGHRIDQGLFAASQRTRRAQLWHGPGPAGEGPEGRRGLHDQASQRLSGERVSALVERHAAGSASPPRRGSPGAGTRARSGLGAESRRDPAGRQRLHDSLPGKALSNRPQGDCARPAGREGAAGEPAGRQPRGALRQARAGVEALSHGPPVRGLQKAGRCHCGREGSSSSSSPQGQRLDGGFRSEKEPAAVAGGASFRRPAVVALSKPKASAPRLHQSNPRHERTTRRGGGWPAAPSAAGRGRGVDQHKTL